MPLTYLSIVCYPKNCIHAINKAVKETKLPNGECLFSATNKHAITNRTIQRNIDYQLMQFIFLWCFDRIGGFCCRFAHLQWASLCSHSNPTQFSHLFTPLSMLCGCRCQPLTWSLHRLAVSLSHNLLVNTFACGLFVCALYSITIRLVRLDCIRLPLLCSHKIPFVSNNINWLLQFALSWPSFLRCCLTQPVRIYIRLVGFLLNRDLRHRPRHGIDQTTDAWIIFANSIFFKNFPNVNNGVMHIYLQKSFDAAFCWPVQV